MVNVNNTLIIIPTYNEEKNIRLLVEKIYFHVPGVNILFVDDNSKDATRHVIYALQKNSTKVSILERPEKLGLGSAYIAGFKWGIERGFTTLIEMDADHSHDPSYLPPFLGVLDKCDFVIGSRYVKDGGVRNWGIVRQMISRFGSFYARFILGKKVADFTGGYNVWNSKIFSQLNLDTIKSEGYSFQIELKYRAICEGFKYIELPIIFADRVAGKSKMSLRIILEAIMQVWAMRLATFKKSSHVADQSLHR